MRQIFIVGMWWMFLGVVRECGSTFLLSARRKNLLFENDKRKRYLCIQGGNLLLLGAFWCGLSFRCQHLRAIQFWTIFLIVTSVSLLISLANNKKHLGCWV